jgi:hypothetical protein
MRAMTGAVRPTTIARLDAGPAEYRLGDVGGRGHAVPGAGVAEVPVELQVLGERSTAVDPHPDALIGPSQRPT